MKEVVINKFFRIEIFNKIIHIERKKDGCFWDGNTYFFNHKKDLKRLNFTLEENEDNFFIRYLNVIFMFPKNIESIEEIRIITNKDVFQIHNQVNTGELPALDETPYIYFSFDNPRIFLPEKGYSSKNKEDYLIQEDVEDVYCILAKRNPFTLRKALVSISGGAEMIRLKNFGLWDSKYYEYTDKTALECIDKFKEYQIPLDNFVIDSDWRNASTQGIGYDVNQKCFPDLEHFFLDAHNRGVEIMFNDHPEPFRKNEMILSKKEILFRETNLSKFLKMGLDSWWYDRNWHTHLISPDNDITWESLGLMAFHDITKNYFEDVAPSKKFARRPVIMGNVSDVFSGTYLGIKDIASHRYSIQWTGDIHSSLPSLRDQLYCFIKAGNSLNPYVNYDCGGYYEDPGKENYLRWIQLGAFSPIFRIHSIKGLPRYHEPWNYDEETVNFFRKYTEMRYHLLPVFYKSAFEAYRFGTPICKSLGFNYPKDKAAIRSDLEFMLSKSILAAPFYETDVLPLPKKHLLGKIKATFYRGISWQRDPIFEEELEELNFRLGNDQKYNSVVGDKNFSAIFSFRIKPKETIDFYIRNDDGIKVFIDGKKTFENLSENGHSSQFIKALKKNVEYKIDVYYYQKDWEANLFLEYKKKNVDNSRIETYLPDDRWISVYSGDIFPNKSKVTIVSEFKELPLFVKEGSLIPLLKGKEHINEEKWDEMIFEYYPSKTNVFEDYLYEDDGVSVAYQHGQYRTTRFFSYFDKEKEEYVIKIAKAKGKFIGDKVGKKRHITFKVFKSLLDKDVKKIIYKNKEIPFEIVKKDEKYYPFNDSDGFMGSDAILFQIDSPLYQESVIRIKI